VKLSDFEVVDLLSEFSECSNNIPNFPYATEGAVGGLGLRDKPIICGGSTFTEDCFIFRDRKWTPGIVFKKLFNSKLTFKMLKKYRYSTAFQNFKSKNDTSKAEAVLCQYP